jgi:hypothetical protein
MGRRVLRRLCAGAATEAPPISDLNTPPYYARGGRVTQLLLKAALPITGGWFHFNGIAGAHGV